MDKLIIHYSKLLGFEKHGQEYCQKRLQECYELNMMLLEFVKKSKINVDSIILKEFSENAENIYFYQNKIIESDKTIEKYKDIIVAINSID